MVCTKSKLEHKRIRNQRMNERYFHIKPDYNKALRQRMERVQPELTHPRAARRRRRPMNMVCFLKRLSTSSHDQFLFDLIVYKTLPTATSTSSPTCCFKHLQVFQDAELVDTIRHQFLLAASRVRTSMELHSVCTNHVDTKQIQHVRATKESDHFDMFPINPSLFAIL